MEEQSDIGHLHYAGPNNSFKFVQKDLNFELYQGINDIKL